MVRKGRPITSTDITVMLVNIGIPKITPVAVPPPPSLAKDMTIAMTHMIAPERTICHGSMRHTALLAATRSSSAESA